MAERAGSDTAVPTPIRAARWVATAGAVVLVVAVATFFTVRGQLADSLLAGSEDPAMTQQKAESATTSMIWTLLVLSVLLGGLQTFFTWRCSRAIRGFRTAATIVLLFSVIFVLAVGSYIGLVGGVLLLVALVLLYLPSANSYFRERSARR